jgi:type IV pilus assembly protein PilB
VTIPLGQLLVDAGTLSMAELDTAEQHQKLQGGSLESCLVALHLVSERDIAAALGCYYGVPSVDLTRVISSADALASVPASVAHRRRLLPVHKSGHTLTVAMADPSDLGTLDELRFLTGCRVHAVVASERAIDEALQGVYPASAPLEQATRALEQEPAATEDARARAVTELPVVQARTTTRPSWRW